MRALRLQQIELIDALVAESALGGITAGLLEKDEHLTDALRALFTLVLRDMSLVFCGGTSLSKAHGLIERMSEDADLKIVLAAQTPPLFRTQLRKRLSELKRTVSETLGGITSGTSSSSAARLRRCASMCLLSRPSARWRCSPWHQLARGRRLTSPGPACCRCTALIASCRWNRY